MQKSRFIPHAFYAELGTEFYDEVDAAVFPRLTLRYRDDVAAAQVGLADLDDEKWLAHFGRFEPFAGSLKKPLALRYHGHQFQNYNPDLGDGRGFLFAQMRHLGDGRLLDFGTKGSGQTPWSRRGDGRLTLKGGVREILASRMLEALGVDTSKSFSLIETHEELMRGDEPSPTRSSVLVRLSHSHIRIGTFQRFTALEQPTNIARLIDHCITHYMPQCADKDGATQTIAFFEEVCRRVAATGARWMQAGFVHGVLNTDNINITGESFDYGPWRFAPTCDPKFTAAYFDEHGLYAFGRQPQTLLWNLTRLAECLLPFAAKSALEQVLQNYSKIYENTFTGSFLSRLGLSSRSKDDDQILARTFWEFLEASRMPFEQAFFDWQGGTSSAKRAEQSPCADYYNSPQFKPVLKAMKKYQPGDADTLSHDYFQRTAPVTMLIDEVEAIWAPIAKDDNWQMFNDKLEDINQMQQAYCK